MCRALPLLLLLACFICACGNSTAAQSVAALPTAHVPTAARRAIVAAPNHRIPTAPPTVQTPPRAVSPAPPVTQTPPRAVSPSAPPMPTPTITPVPLPAVVAAPPPPTAPPAAPSATPPQMIVPATPPASTGGAVAAPGSIPILMYHYVRVVDRSVDPLGYELSVTPDHFAQQLAWLHDNSYTTVRMEQLTRCLSREATCPAKSVALTFDDGYEDAYTTALPLLQKFGFTATFYIISGFVGHPGYMSWEQLGVLHDAGMEIGAHSVTHRNLTDLDMGMVASEVTQSKRDIEQALGITVTSFCYPAGHYNAAIEEQVRAAGYTNATTTRWDANWSDVFALPRRRISGDVNGASFAWIAQN
jgi:peptidoglycan/xylan/chitin deacetylase (PgdA/CDA1 family)